jgi:hypothetical protein
MKKFLLALCVLPLLLGSALAEGLSGCTFKGVENCLFLKTVEGKTYALYVMTFIPPNPGRGVSVQGFPYVGLGFCGTPAYTVTSWNYNKLRCPMKKR